MKKTLKYFIVFLMLFSVFIPVSGNETPTDGSGNFTTTSKITENLVTSFEFSYNDKEGNWTEVVGNGGVIEVDVEDLNSVRLKYGLTIPNDVTINAGDTLTIDLPSIYSEQGVSDQSITIDGTQVATYSIDNDQVIITFNENANNFDNVEMFVDLSGSFNTEIFETEEEVVVEVPYRGESSYRVTIRPEQQAYDGTDKKEAGSPYILNEDGSKTTDRNPTHIDWTVRVNDSMGRFTNATVIDELGENLEIVEDSFVVKRIIRNYNNEETGRERVNATPEITSNGFELNLGDIKDAYDITYTTRIIRPDGGGTKEINNNARIILSGNENNVSDNFTGTWSGDIPTITKSGSKTDDPHVLNWEVEYNYGKENLGTVNLTDNLTHGVVDLSTVKVYTVDVDIDGKRSNPQFVDVTPVLSEDGTLTIPNLDADGKAYYITYSSSVPVGLNTTIKNTITDKLEIPNTASDSVDVDTVPTGGKVGEQKVDNEGRPYIEWTITLNSTKVDVGSITIRDVFNPDYLEFDVKESNLYELYKDGKTATNFTIGDYTHTDNRTGFKLDINNAGPHTYKFVYRTYYTVAGLQQPELANHAELVFLDGQGDGIGPAQPSYDATLEGPKAGIHKSGKYVTRDNDTIQEIEWVIEFNESKVLLENPKISDAFTSENFTYVEGSMTITENDVAFDDYNLQVTNNSFEININKHTNAKYVITYRTTTDDEENNDQENTATLTWQGGSESDTASVGKRSSGIEKLGEVVINLDGSKTVNWTVNFNTNKNVVHDLVLVDTYTPSTVTVSNIKITTGKVDVTNQFTISDDRTGGSFTVSKDRLDAKEYQLTYSTTLSPEEERVDIRNTVTATYRGGSNDVSKTIPKPTLFVSKQANEIVKTDGNPLINWTINANTDSANKFVNLVDAVLEDAIPLDQKLVSNSIKVYRKDNPTVEITGLTIGTTDNSFRIELPNGPFQYIVTFQTEILQIPSLDSTQFDRYNNSVVLSNQTKNETLKHEAKDNAWIRYYAKKDNDLTAKTGSQNDDTENLDYEVTINPEGLTIHNAKIKDTLSTNHTYVDNTIKLYDADGVEVTTGFNLYLAENSTLR